jgi:hypothetical protein
MSVKSKDFVYEDPQKRKRFKAVMQKAPKRVVKTKKPNNQLERIAKTEYNG